MLGSGLTGSALRKLGLRKNPTEFFKRYLENVAIARLGSSKRAKPMVSSLYITMKCNFRCTYCDDGSGNMYPDLAEQRLETARTIEVMRVMRRASPGFNLTGGEPTVRADVDQLAEAMGELGFFPVTFNTNGFLMHKHLRVLHHIDYLVVSLDCLDPSRGDALIDVKPGMTARVLENIQLCQRYKAEQGLAFNTVVNTVIFPETIDDAWEVFAYCNAQGLFWSPMPHIVGKYPNPGLVDNPRWLELVDEVMRAKKAGAKVFGNLPSLRNIRDFSRYECYPQTRPIIYPNGDLFYPCSPLNTVGANLLETGDYFKAVEAGLAKHGPIPYCDARCHLSCYMETSNLISHPEETLIEAMGWMAPARRVELRRPLRSPERSMPPPFAQLRALPSMPADDLRRLQAAGQVENDFTSRLRVKTSGARLGVLQEGGCSGCRSSAA